VTVEVPVWDGRIAAQVWRVDVGRVPLYLLDAAVPANPRLAQLVTARLYDGNHAIRLAQYALLGYGGARMLAALGIEPEVVHLNEGHAALATLALAHAHRGPGESMRDAIDRTRGRVVFTTHTPVAAGNETYAPDEMRDVFDGLCTELGISGDDLLGFGRVHADDVSERSGMTPLAIRAARSTNAVSERHGTVAAQMWAPMGATVTWVTNGVHAPTWISEPMHALLDTAFGRGWEAHADDAHMWARVDDIPDTDLWAVRNALRARLVRTVRERSITDRLLRGEDLDYVLAAAEAMDDARLTVGFARRLATYKRLHLLSLEPDRALGVLPHLQFLFAGKAHPSDDGAKRVAQQLFELKGSPEVGARVAFIEDYDLSIAPVLTAGCDVWLNLPRPPLEASGTSGMKAALNGALNLSVLDGWWAEAYDGANGWAIDGSPDDDTDAQDRRDAAALFDLLERDVVPQFETRDGDGIPRAWVTRVKASLRTIGPRFNATRMLREYERDVYRLT
jgi:starch phosphorylase